MHTKRSTTLLIKKITHLILEHGTAKGPDSSEDEVELVQLLVAVWRCILRHQESLKEVTQHLDHGDVYQWSDLLESVDETDLEQLNLKKTALGTLVKVDEKLFVKLRSVNQFATLKCTIVM